MARLAAALLAGLALLAGCAKLDPDEALPLGSDAPSCGSCHEDHYDEWRGSPHGTSADSPVLAALLPDVEAHWGELARDTCEGCHSPGHSEDSGIGCVSCHAATGNHAERDGMLAVDLAAPLAGPFDDPEQTLAHRSRASGFLESPSLCGTCHEITGPNLVNEPTLTEYRASPQAAEGLTCADCHMPAGPDRPLSNDSARLRTTRSHRFVGFDPPWGAGREEADAAAARTRDMLAAALALRVEAIEGGVAVIVENVGAGHSVPTGATFLRDLWVDVERDGVVVAPRVLRLGDQPMDGERPVPLLTQADHVVAGSLAAGETRRVEVALEGPLTAVLRGRAVRQEVLEALGLTERAAEVPTHEIATAAAP